MSFYFFSCLTLTPLLNQQYNKCPYTYGRPCPHRHTHTYTPTPMHARISTPTRPPMPTPTYARPHAHACPRICTHTVASRSRPQHWSARSPLSSSEMTLACPPHQKHVDGCNRIGATPLVLLLLG